MNQNLQVLLIAFLCLLVICIYGKYRCSHPNYHDPLMQKLGVLDLDGWSLTHFGFFALLGYLYPTKFWLSMSLGVGWEVFEHIVGKNRPDFLGGFGGKCMTTDPNVDKKGWWFGRASDIIMNLLGFLVGSYFSK